MLIRPFDTGAYGWYVKMGTTVASGTYTASPSLDDGIPHVLAIRLQPPEIYYGSSTVNDLSYEIMVDWVIVDSGTIQSSYANSRDAFYNAGDSNQNFQVASNSVDGLFSHIAINGGVDAAELAELRQAYLRNFIDYVDPNCA